jgi:hypothetical protein
MQSRVSLKGVSQVYKGGKPGNFTYKPLFKHMLQSYHFCVIVMYTEAEHRMDEPKEAKVQVDAGRKNPRMKILLSRLTPYVN